MEYRKLGKTGLEVSLISFGALQLGSVPQEEVNRMVDHALEKGINYIDTARVYGQSEVKLGKALAGRRDDVILSTKVISRDLSSFKKDLQTCLDNLRTDYIDILFSHDISTIREWEQVSSNGVIEFMKELKEKGVARHLAISTHSAEVGKRILAEGPYEVIMVAYNAANPETGDQLIPLARARDMGIVIMKPYAGGILTEKGSENLGFSIKAADSLRYAASRPDITTVIPGLDKMEYLQTALEVAGMNLDLSEEERQEIADQVEIKSEYYCRSCGYCLPCPEGLNIPEILNIYNRREAFAGVNWAQMHVIQEDYQNLEKKADTCISCNKCTERCPYDLPVSELMNELSTVF